MEAERLGGFCLLMKREVLRRIDSQGQLDKWTDLALFDSDIVSAKAREADSRWLLAAICSCITSAHEPSLTAQLKKPSPNRK